MGVAQEKESNSYVMSSFLKIPTVSIIGSAGRRGDGSKLTSEIFHRAIDKTKEVIQEKFKLSLDQVHLVSGGAAWMGQYYSNNWAVYQRNYWKWEEGGEVNQCVDCLID